MRKMLLFIALVSVLMFAGCTQQSPPASANVTAPAPVANVTAPPPVVANVTAPPPVVVNVTAPPVVENVTPPANPGSASFQLCISQCGGGNVGNGTLCQDGCAVREAADTKSTARCDTLINIANRPSCYGTVAKAAGNISICETFTNTTERNHCVSVFGSQGASG